MCVDEEGEYGKNIYFWKWLGGVVLMFEICEKEKTMGFNMDYWEMENNIKYSY